jgi:hypothetical protein
LKNRVLQKGARRKVTQKKVTRKKAVVASKTSKRKVARSSAKSSRQDTSSINITPEDRWKLIAVAAYHKAERRGFAPGGELQDWIDAEQEIDRLMSG